MEFLKEFAYLRDINTVSIVFRFIIAVICGGAIGIDRGRKNQAAGLRTHLLVCIGSASVMMVNQYISTYLNIGADMSRMGAQVISGIGFLGAGTIIITGKKQIKGLTTAAGLWASACMGLAIGIGFYECALIMCLFLSVVLLGLNRLDDMVKKANKHIELYLEYEPGFRLSSVLKVLIDNGWHAENIDYISNGNDVGSMQISAVKGKAGIDSKEIIEKIRVEKYVFFTEDI